MNEPYGCYPLSTAADLSVSSLEAAIRERFDHRPVRLVCDPHDFTEELQQWIVKRQGLMSVSFVPSPLLKCPGAWAVQFADGNYVISGVFL